MRLLIESMEGSFLMQKGCYMGHVTCRRPLPGCLAIITGYGSQDNISGWHCHENHYLDFVLEGSEVERTKEGSYVRNVGTTTFYYPGDVHETILRSTYSRCLILEFEPQFFHALGIKEVDISELISSNSKRNISFVSIINELINPDLDTNLSLVSLITAVFDLDGRSYSAHPPNWIVDAKEYLNDNWYRLTTLHELSIITDLHPVTISKNFPKYFGCTLGEYKRKLRISKSIEMLMGTDVPLTDIAMQCGFADQSHFTRTFRQLTGLVPKAVRRL